MERLTEVIDSTLRRIEAALMSVASMSHVNAMLSMADPTLLLPSPAVGLIEVAAPSSFIPRAGMVLRSLEPIGPEGEVMFRFVDSDFVAHPWRVSETEWIVDPVSGADDSNKGMTLFAHGIMAKMRRPQGSRCKAGRFSLLVLGGPTVCWGLERAHVFCGDTRLGSRRPPLFQTVRTSALPRPGAVHDHFDAFSQDLLEIDIPRQLVGESECEIHILFEESVPVPRDRRPAVVANVTAIWNSIDCRYPGPTEIEQSVSESPNRTVHPLQARHLGRSWKAWDVTYVGASNDPKINFEPRRFYKRPLNTDMGTFHLAYVRTGGRWGEDRFSSSAPRKPLGENESQTFLSVVLSPEARAVLDREGKHLAVEFRVTTGRAANGIPDGTEFQVIDTTGLPLMDRIIGRSIGDTWGGSDGASAAVSDCSCVGYVQSFFPSGYVRTIGDVLRIVEQCYGRDLEVVDERDLLRSPENTETTSLLVRVRFKRIGRDEREKRVVLASCQQFVNRYLFGNFSGEVQLVDVDEGVVVHETGF